MLAAQNNNEFTGGAPLVVALDSSLELSPLMEEAGSGPAKGPRANDGLMWYVRALGSHTKQTVNKRYENVAPTPKTKLYINV